MERLRHLDLLNVLLALRFRQPGYPPCFAEHGYLLQSVGVTFILPDGTRVVPDAVLSSPRCALTLLVEVKGGRSLDGDQLDRMLRTTPTDLRDLAHLPIDDAGNHRVHVMVLCNEIDREAMAEARGERQVTIVGFDGRAFRTSGAQLPDKALDGSLRSAAVAEGATTLDIVPFDAESSDVEVARVLIPHVVDALVHGHGTIDVESLLAKTHPVVHSEMQATGSGSEWAKTVQKTKGVMKTLAATVFKDDLEGVQGRPVYRVRRTFPVEPRARSHQLRRLQTAAQQFLEELGGARGVQLDMQFADSVESADAAVVDVTPGDGSSDGERN